MGWDPVWEEVYRTRPWGKYPPEDVIRFVARHFYGAPDRAAVRLLEVGSGTGANLWFMAREGFCVHGVEASETAVRLSQARLDAECAGWREAGGKVVTGDLLALPYPDAHFDAALDVVAVCYSNFGEARRAYAELARVVKPGGSLFVRTFARSCWGECTGERIDSDMWACSEGPLAGLGPTRFTDAAQVAELLEGWRVEGVEQSSVTYEGGRQTLKHLIVEASREP